MYVYIVFLFHLLRSDKETENPNKTGTHFSCKMTWKAVTNILNPVSGNRKLLGIFQFDPWKRVPKPGYKNWENMYT